MKLHRIHVENFKAVAERTLDVPDTGLVIASGLNEVGKTSLVEALDLILDTRRKHTSRSGDVRAAQPYGSSLPVVVEAELTVGPHRVVHTKQFLSHPSATLRFVSGPRRGEILTGEEAVDTMGVLWQDADVTLWNALRLLQDSSLSAVALGESPSLGAALDALALGDEEAVDTGEALPLLDLAREEYGRYWTATGRPNAALSGAREAAAATRDDLAAATAALEEVDHVVDDLTTATEDLTARRGALARAQEEADAAREAVAALADLEDRASRTARDLEEARRRATEAQRAHSRRTDLVTEAQTLAARQAETARNARELAGQLEEVATELDAASGSLSEATAARRAARATWDRWRRRVEDDGRARELAELRTRVDKVDALTAEVSRLRRQVDSCPVTEEAMAGAEKAGNRLDAARQAVTLASPRIDVRRLGEGPELLVDGTAVESEDSRTVDGPMLVEIPGAWQVRVTPDARVSELAEEVRAAREALGAALDGLGVTDLTQARQALLTRQQAQTELAVAEDSLARLLDGQGRDALAARRDELAAAVGTACDEETTDPEEVRRQARHAEADSDAAEEAEATARARHEAVAARHARAREDATRADLTLEQASQAARAARDRLDGEREEAGDEDLGEAFEAARRDLDEATETHEEAAAALAEHHPEELRARQRETAAAVERARARLSTARDRRAGLEGRLEGLGREARQSRHEDLAALDHRRQAELEGLESRAGAARRLWQVLDERRSAARHAYVAPFTERITALGQRVFGSDFAVEIDDDLAVVSRDLHGSRVAWSQLSTGAREQLGLLVRLAAADLVDPADGVPVILDDALVYSDRVRVRRLLEALARGARTSQIIVLTCAEERYDALEGATRVQF